MVDAKKNPLNSFVSTTAGSNDIKLPPYPKLGELVAAHGFSGALEKFDQQMEERRQSHEKLLNERITGKPAVDISKSNA
jgi:hypothetical protein